MAIAGDPAALAVYVRDLADGARWRLTSSVTLGSPLEPGVTVPAEEIAAGDWFAALPDGARVFTGRSGGGAWGSAAPKGLPPGVVEVDFASAADGWALLRSGECAGAKTVCAADAEVRVTRDGGQTWSPLALPATSQ